ncbi:MAG: hypothetical protein RR397_07945 [Odoribacter sp.]
MDQKYTDIGNYFESLSQLHPGIKTFCRYELDELLDKDVSISDYPALILEGFDFNFSGSGADNILKSRNGAFCIVDVCDIFDPVKRTESLERAEIIAEQILLKMVKDKRDRVPLLTSFDISSAEGMHFVNPALGYIFCRISFSFKTKIKEDTAVWQ